MALSIISNPLGSLNFNGTNQYITTAALSQNTLGTNNFTAECWFYSSAVSGFGQIIGMRSSAYPFAPFSLINASGTVVLYSSGDGTSWSIANGSSVAAISLNFWYHVAIVRNGNNLNVYLNGVSRLQLTITGTNFPQSSPPLLSGGGSYLGPADLFAGYVSNIRFVNGVAVYTGNFVPPIQPLLGTQSSGTNTSAITGTQTTLLLQTPNNSAVTTDSSANQFTITNVNATPSASLNPFNYLPLGSVSLNGTTQSLSIPANTAAFSYGANDFTWECWVNPTSTGGTGNIPIDFFSNPTGTFIVGQCQIVISAARAVGFYYATTTSAFTNVITSTAAIALNTWSHIAVVRSGSGTGNLKIYINGVLAATSAGAVTQNLGSTGAGNIGKASDVSGQFFNGYISNPRIVNGVAVYTGNFTPSTQPLAISQNTGPNITAVTGTQTSLLLQTPNNANFIKDSSTNNFTLTNNGAATATALSPFNFVPATGGWQITSIPLGSVSLNGSTQALSIPANAAFSFAGDFTWECWVNPTSFAGNSETIDFFTNTSGSYIIGQCQIQINVTTGTVGFYYATTISAAASIVSTATLSLSTWSHIAVVRSGSGVGNLKLYINGVVAATSAGAVTQVLGSTGAGSIGRQTSSSTLYLNGYISNIRIVAGVAVYTGNFTVPTAPLQATQPAGANISAITGTQTSLLLQTPNNANFITDSSANNFGLTNVGAATAAALTPFNSGVSGGWQITA